jgi:hypothetical protein
MIKESEVVTFHKSSTADKCRVQAKVVSECKIHGSKSVTDDSESICASRRLDGVNRVTRVVPISGTRLEVK